MKRIFALLTISLFLFGGVLAEMSISEPKDIYNLGEKLYVTLDGITGSNEGNLNINLICSDETVNLLRVSARSFSLDGTQSYSLPYKFLTTDDLELDILDTLVGDCNIVASLGSTSVSTKSFDISNQVNVNTKLNKLTYNPGDEIIFSIDATNVNGEPFIGYYDIKNFTLLSGEINGVEVTENILLSDNQKAGTYILTSKIYDKDANGNILNSGSKTDYFVIDQKATTLDLVISKLTINPDDNLTVNPELLDQSGELMEESVSVYVESPEGFVTTYTIKSGEYLDIFFESNASMGIWNVYTFLGDIFSDRYEIDVLGVAKLEYVIEGSVLNVKNLGNVVYDDVINVSIGDVNHTLDLTLGAGEIKQFNLQAPDGEYNINVAGSNAGIFTGSVLLTGNSVSVKDVSKGSGWIDYSWLWIFLILICGGFVFVMSNKSKLKITLPTRKEKTRKINRFNFKKVSLSRQKKKSKTIKTRPVEDGLIDIQDKKVVAKSTLVLNGEKMNSCVLALHLSNYDDLENPAKNALANILKDISSKGVIETKDDYVFAIFNPLVTKTYKNEMTTTKAGLKLVNELNNFNRKFKDKILFGAGIHSGDIIAEKSGRTLKYTGIGETFTLAKKISNLADGKLFVSDVIRKKLLRELRVIKEGEINKQGIYSVSEIKNREANEAKLKDLLKRMD